MERKCGKCKGEGGRYRNKPKGTYLGLFGSSREWIRCDACGGTGENPKYRQTRCERCYTTIGYSVDSKFPPKYCQSCKPLAAAEKQRQRDSQQRSTYQSKQPRQDNNWLEKSCPGLKGENGCSWHNTIRYRTDWDKPPNLCPNCIAKIKQQKAERDAKMREKPCAGECGNIIHYNVDWDNVPNLCKDCKGKLKSHASQKIAWRHDQPLPSSDRSLNDLKSQGINGVSVRTNGIGGYHVTLFSESDRYSYDTTRSGNFLTGSSHYTDAAAKLLGKNTIGSNPSNENRW